MQVYIRVRDYLPKEWRPHGLGLDIHKKEDGTLWVNNHQIILKDDIWSSEHQDVIATNLPNGWPGEIEIDGVCVDISNLTSLFDDQLVEEDGYLNDWRIIFDEDFGWKSRTYDVFGMNLKKWNKLFTGVLHKKDGTSMLFSEDDGSWHLRLTDTKEVVERAYEMASKAEVGKLGDLVGFMHDKMYVLKHKEAVIASYHIGWIR